MKDGVKLKMEGLEDSDKPTKLLMIHVLSNEPSMEQVGGARDKEQLETEPSISDKSCTYRLQ